MQEELWTDIQGYENRYQVSNYGRVRSLVANGQYINEAYHLMKPSKHRDGYLRVQFKPQNQNKPKCFLIHRLVALHFIPNPDPENLREINHKDGNKENNYFENLEWCTRSYNVQHAFDTGLKVNKKGPEHPLSKTFYQFDLNGKLLGKWTGALYCARILHNLNPNLGEPEVIRGDIQACLTGRYKTACGFIFSYENSINLEDHKHITPPTKSVIGVNIKDGTELIFNKVTDANGYVTKEGKPLQATMITKCCKGKRASHGGYKWKYL